MARIRTIKPEFPQSESIGKLSRDARLLFVQLWTLADDDGRARASPRMLASLLFPYDDDAPAMIGGWIDELARVGCIRRYAVNGSAYLDIPGWADHQKIDKPSKSRLPEFVANTSENPPPPQEPTRTNREPSRDFDEHSRTVVMGRDLGREGTKEEALLTQSSSAENADGASDEDLKIGKPKKTRVSAEEKRQLQAFGESWNRLASRHGLPSVELIKPGSGRERNALARLRDITDDYHANVEALWDKISASSFLRGEKSFVCTFDFVVNSANFTKIMEGNYADKKGKQSGYEPGRNYRQG